MSRADSNNKNDWLDCELFHEFQAACAMNDSKAALNSLTAWLGQFCQELQFFSTKQFSQSFGNQRFAEQLALVRMAVEDPQTNWSGEQLLRAVTEAVHEIHASRSSADRL